VPYPFEAESPYGDRDRLPIAGGQILPQIRELKVPLNWTLIVFRRTWTRGMPDVTMGVTYDVDFHSG
jgi:hypothetical protein